MVLLIFIHAIATLRAFLPSAARCQEKPKPAFTIAPDPTFGSGGFQADHIDLKARSSDQGRFLTLDKQGRPIVAGNSTGQKFAVARYLSDGRPDATFGSVGKAAICIEDES